MTLPVQWFAKHMPIGGSPNGSEQDASGDGNSTSGEDRLFVYGTLRSHQPAHNLLGPNVRRLDAAITSGTLWALPAGYPGFLQGIGTVHGEVVWLNDIATTFDRLDAYEGNEYARVTCAAVLSSGQPTSAWIYVLSDPGLTENAEWIASGDWIAYQARMIK